MTSSTWHALGNTYVVVEPTDHGLDAAGASTLAQGTDGVLEVLDRTESVGRDRHLEPRWLPCGAVGKRDSDRSGVARRANRCNRGGRRGRRTRRSAPGCGASGDIEQDLGEVVVGAAETIDGITFVPVSVGNPHAVVAGDPAQIGVLGPLLEKHERFPERTNVQVARDRRPR